MYRLYLLVKQSVIVLFLCVVANVAQAGDGESLHLLQNASSTTNPLTINGVAPGDMVEVQLDESFDHAKFHRAVMAVPQSKVWMKRISWSINLLFLVPEFYSMGTGFTDQATRDLGINNNLFYKLWFGSFSALSIILLGGEAGMILADMTLPDRPELKKYFKKETSKLKLPVRVLEGAFAAFISGFSGPSITYLFHNQYKDMLGRGIYPLDAMVCLSSAFGFLAYELMLGRPIGDRIIHRFSIGDSEVIGRQRAHLMSMLYGAKNNLLQMNKREVNGFWQKMQSDLGEHIDESKVLLTLLHYSDLIKEKTSLKDPYSKLDIVCGLSGALLTVLSAYADFPLGKDSMQFFTELLFGFKSDILNVICGVCNVASMQFLNAIFTALLAVNVGRWVKRTGQYAYKWWNDDLDKGTDGGHAQACWSARDALWCGLNAFAVILSMTTGTSAIYVALANLTSNMIFNIFMVTSTVIGNTFPNTQGFYMQVNRIFGADKEKYDILHMLDRYLYSIPKLHKDYIQAIYQSYENYNVV